MRLAIRWTTLAVACTLGVAGSPAGAQRPVGADTLSEAAIAESLAVLKELRTHLAKNKQDAAAWYRRGMIAWALHDRDRVPGGAPGLDWTLLGREADLAIRTADAIEPTNVRYQLTKGQFFLGTGLVFMRVQSYIVFDHALRNARASGDSLLLAEAAVELGRVHWRRYDPSNFGAVPASVRDRARSLVSDSALSRALLADDPYLPDRSQPYTRRSLRQARELLIAEFNDPKNGFDGEYDYTLAEQYFREAFTAMRSYSRGYRQLSMLLAERARWPELAGLARMRVQVAPGDAWAWMSLGLASHRDGDARNAALAFEKGLAAMDSLERARLDQLTRVLRPRDVDGFARLSTAERATAERFYWRSADPLWSDDGAEPRTEFLARVTYAELRWTVDEMLKRGADSDRGNVHIRYGPADSRLRGTGGGESWWYDYARMGFHFTSAPTFATAYFSNPAYAANMMDSVPARWDNIADVRINSLPVHVARFRAAQDSVDVFFAARLPIEEIREASDVAGPVRTNFWLLRNGLDEVVRTALPDTGGFLRSWTQRTAPDDFLFRIEARAEGSLVAARSESHLTTGTDLTTGFATSGFGISDLLLASSIVTPASVPARWRGMAFTPLAGPVVGDKQLSLVWENYDFTARDAAAEYDVAITIRRERTAAGRLTARIIGGVTGREISDRVEMEYDRRVAHASTLVEHITISLGDTPTGTYLLSLQVTDRASGRSASRSVRIAVR